MIEIKNLCHTYKGSVVGVKNISLTIRNGETVAVVGISGAGKSTLLRCINRLIEPTSGQVFIDGQDIVSCPESKARLIRRKIGMVFQTFNLLLRLPAIKSVLMGRLGYTYYYRKADMEMALDCLRKVGMEDLAYRRADRLSGGQQQRVGVARALAQQPSIILGDEPVSNLDPTRKREIMDLLGGIQRETGMTLVVSLHDIDLAKKYASRIIGMVKGEVVFDGKPDELDDEKIIEIFA